MASIKIFIGYRTIAVDNVEDLIPVFQANRTLKDEAKIKADLEEKKQTFLASAKDMPYTGTLAEVVINDPRKQNLAHFLSESRSPVSVRVRKFLLDAYPNAWPEDTHDVRPPEFVVFIGFNPRLFLKMLGLECSLPHINKPLPPKLWYANADHRDIEEALIPTEFRKFINLAVALKRRRPPDADSAKAWDALLKDWTGPGYNPEKDARLSFELAAQLGFLP